MKKEEEQQRLRKLSDDELTRVTGGGEFHGATGGWELATCKELDEKELCLNWGGCDWVCVGTTTYSAAAGGSNPYNGSRPIYKCQDSQVLEAVGIPPVTYN